MFFGYASFNGIFSQLVYLSLSDNASLTEIIKQNDPTAEKLTNIKVANQAAISYISNTLGVEKKVALLSRDRKYLITISTPFNFNQGRPTTVFNQAVFDLVVSSFAFKQ